MIHSGLYYKPGIAQGLALRGRAGGPLRVLRGERDSGRVVRQGRRRDARGAPPAPRGASRAGPRERAPGRPPDPARGAPREGTPRGRARGPPRPRDRHRRLCPGHRRDGAGLARRAAAPSGSARGSSAVAARRRPLAVRRPPPARSRAGSSSAAPGSRATASPASAASTRASGSSRSAASTTSCARTAAPSYGTSSTRCRTRGSRSSASTSRGGSPGGVEAGPNAVLAFRREGYSKTSFSLAGHGVHVLLAGLLEARRNVPRDRPRGVLALVEQGGLRHGPPRARAGDRGRRPRAGRLRRPGAGALGGRAARRRLPRRGGAAADPRPERPVARRPPPPSRSAACRRAGDRELRPRPRAADAPPLRDRARGASCVPGFFPFFRGLLRRRRLLLRRRPELPRADRHRSTSPPIDRRPSPAIL